MLSPVATRAARAFGKIWGWLRRSFALALKDLISSSPNLGLSLAIIGIQASVTVLISSPVKKGLVVLFLFPETELLPVLGATDAVIGKLPSPTRAKAPQSFWERGNVERRDMLRGLEHFSSENTSGSIGRASLDWKCLSQFERLCEGRLYSRRWEVDESSNPGTS